MRTNLTLPISAGLVLAACQAQGPPPIAEMVPPPHSQPVAESELTREPTSIGTASRYDARWVCDWNDDPADWDLPVVRIDGDKAYAFNEWTRLDGRVLGDQLILEGERKSADGRWYRMEMAGPVFRDAPSELHGYWKGANCKASLRPLNAGDRATQDPAQPSAAPAAEVAEDPRPVGPPVPLKR
ncbi:hypothetical protein [Thalassobaculum sp.]|uniref:hypothetical protein n=1 Tax=Thalassobaculum sp. TaxID=2022740 RepID=UPI0032EC141D